MAGLSTVEGGAGSLKDIPVGKHVVRSSASSDELFRLMIGRVYDIQTSHWRVPHPDEAWMETSRSDLTHWDEGYQGTGSRE